MNLDGIWRRFLHRSRIRAIINLVQFSRILMAYAQKQRYRITLELDVMDDFDPYQIDWRDLFKLEGSEKITAYVEDINRNREFVW